MQTITGKFIQNLPRVEGDNAKGHWVRGGFIIEHGDEFTRKAAFSLFGEERVKKTIGILPGTLVQVDYQPESREFNDRWYTDLQCFNVTPLTTQM